MITQGTLEEGEQVRCNNCRNTGPATKVRFRPAKNNYGFNCTYCNKPDVWTPPPQEEVKAEELSAAIN